MPFLICGDDLTPYLQVRHVYCTEWSGCAASFRVIGYQPYCVHMQYQLTSDYKLLHR